MKNILTISILILILASCKEEKNQKQTGSQINNGPLKVEAVILSPTSLSNKIEVAGNILPFELTEIRPEISGRVTQINFKEGSNANKNDLLVKLSQ